MQNEKIFEPITLITATAAMAADVHGGRAKCLQRLVRLDMPVPLTVALSFKAMHDIAIGQMPDMAALISPFGVNPLLSVRPSSQDPDWGGPSAILNVGMNDVRYDNGRRSGRGRGDCTLSAVRAVICSACVTA